MRYEKAVSVEVLRPYVVEVVFADGSAREIDLESELYGTVFEPLKDPEFFARVRVDEIAGVLTWPNGADLAPEFTYTAGKPKATSGSR
jgi:hypothetical protein